MLLLLFLATAAAVAAWAWRKWKPIAPVPVESPTAVDAGEVLDTSEYLTRLNTRVAELSSQWHSFISTNGDTIRAISDNAKAANQRLNELAP